MAMHLSGDRPFQALQRHGRSCFFFQAEDGIRDADVTGVQTCALPISLAGEVPDNPSITFNLGLCAEQAGNYEKALELYHAASRVGAYEGKEGADRAIRLKIGRASCRERV